MGRVPAPFAIAITLGLLGCSDAPMEPVHPPADPAQPAPAVPTIPTTAAIAFESTRDGSPHIYVANADGSGVTRVTEGSSPAWSHDGRKIAFIREASGPSPGGLYVVDFDESVLSYLGPARVVGPGRGPAWSSDERVAVTWSTGWFTADLYVMNADGSGPTSVFSPGSMSDWCPTWRCSTVSALLPVLGAAAWSPDGRSLAFREHASQQVFVMDADGSGSREIEELPEPGSAPAWSPDGTKIAIITDPGLWKICGVFSCEPGPGVGKNSVIHTYDLVSGDQAAIEPVLSVAAVRGSNPEWSPDGSQLVFDLFDPTLSYDSDGSYRPEARIFVMSMETGEARQLIPEATDPAAARYRDSAPAWVRAHP